jgi:cytochrome c oxidase assembly protein subunit 15
MVVLGGVTRLTRSGLSIVEWRPAGEALPFSDAEWEVEFAKYRASPEFQRVNSGMDLEEFKPIYLMELAHRQWGRAIGLLFILPLGGLAAAGFTGAGAGFEQPATRATSRTARVRRRFTWACSSSLWP